MNDKIRVHRNLHRARIGGPQWVQTERGRVKGYLEEITLEEVSTRIQAGGRRRCEEKQVRSVCGFLDGVPGGKEGGQPSAWRRISFDPRVDETFMAEGKRWNRAEAVRLCGDGSAWALRPRWEE